MRRARSIFACAALAAAVATSAPLPAGAENVALDTDTLLQIALERQMFSMNAIDGVWGAKSKAALAAWLAANGHATPATREEALRLITDAEDDAPPPYRLVKVRQSEIDSLVKIPATPAEKAILPAMGYETILEMYAERGHATEAMMRRLNPRARWPNPPAGTVLRIPNVATTNKPPKAALVRVNLATCRIGVHDATGRLIALFPCSIAADKAKRPPSGSLCVKGIAPSPNYTYTSEKPDFTGRRRKYIYPAGPNNPVGAAWIGLSLPSYGIHGTPHPETIGRAESHGCFRLANWNAIRLRDMVSEGCPVEIE